MGIKKKILIYFSLTTISLTGIALLFIYTLFAQYREEEFQQRQKEKIKSTLYFLTEIKKTNHNLIEAIDRLTINDLYNEKLLIFNQNKKLIYSSIDDTPIRYSKEIIENLSEDNEWYEGKENLYDVVGLYFRNEGNAYYGISKAYDKFGYSKLNYLKWVLCFTFLIIAVSIVLISYFLSDRITKSLLTITKKIINYNFEEDYDPIQIKPSENEISVLAEQFNKLMKRMNEVFAFQKHVIHHISHELKTPIAILVSNFEKIEKETDLNQIKTFIKNQKEDTRNLSNIINSLLEISRAETGNVLMTDKIRIDDLLFDIADELKQIYPDFQFSIEYALAETEKNLIISCNARLIKAALLNLMQNCILYSDNGKAILKIYGFSEKAEITFENSGKPIGQDENRFLFKHFFRGENSMGKRGFGLGLVFVHKIITLHGGTVSYQSPNQNSNIFTISIPLR